MDDIDQALAGMSAGKSGISDDRRSYTSGRTGDLSTGETDEGGDAEVEYEKRAKARAALAVNAARNHDEADEAERAEQARLKAQAMKVFEEEEEKHRQLLLKKEEEHNHAAAQGTLPSEKPKTVPIPGVDMSDESDSEGSDDANFDDAPPTTHAPLFAGTASANPISEQTTPKMETGGEDNAEKPTTDLDSHVGKKEGQTDNSSEVPTAAKAAGAAAVGTAIVGSAAAIAHNEKSDTGSAAQPVTSLDSRSVESASASGSPAKAVSTNAETSVGTAPTSVVGTETPKSYATTAQRSPAPSTTASRATAPTGDPHEWTVEQVVDWGRSKGWDEATVVSKFAEHEISGDVLMEMDINILKEIDISAFGKRFQVANAIKELKKPLQPAVAAGERSPSTTDVDNAGQQALLGQQQAFLSSPQHSPGAGTAATPTAVAGLGGAALGAAAGSGIASSNSRQRELASPIPDTSLSSSQLAASPRNKSFDEESLDEMKPLRGPSSNRFSGERDLQESDLTPGRTNRNSKGGQTAPDSGIQYSSFSSQHATSPKKRESGSSSGAKSPSDRSSFFGGFAQRNRKPAPKSQTGSLAGAEGDFPSSLSKGTFSRLGLNRLKGSHSSQDIEKQQDFRNKISLPTDSPRFDAMGDTARRSRMTQAGAMTSGIPGFGGHQKRASVGSAGAQAAEFSTANNDVHGAQSPGGTLHEGAVMARIRPVEHEGWMRKKGERYNSWKPRYMAIKGSDLVLLRDPTAPKIKGYVNMRGYKVIADENTNPGKYGFKILHESEKPHYFSSDDAIVVREWMKALMKATIGRDTSLPVISSYNNATMSLKEAQRMNPPPRPPSPTSRARAQRAAARQNKDQLTAKDASVLMGLQTSNGASM